MLPQQDMRTRAGQGGKASRDYIASFFHALATAGTESSEGFGAMADQLDAIFKRLSGTAPAPRAAKRCQ
ncbi:Serine/threonine protein kinase [Phytophthora cinnamomi]|uniref:Serine/threonine protein kinase n=1 Tax=Phytophthora cinnamomi TaxID=4785 RepID=UPI003559E2E7|nr:Serine/threonine protein kinase [Phytophthora cinnamomi]